MRHNDIVFIIFFRLAMMIVPITTQKPIICVRCHHVIYFTRFSRTTTRDCSADRRILSSCIRSVVT